MGPGGGEVVYPGEREGDYGDDCRAYVQRDSSLGPICHVYVRRTKMENSDDDERHPL